MMAPPPPMRLAWRALIYLAVVPLHAAQQVARPPAVGETASHPAPGSFINGFFSSFAPTATRSLHSLWSAPEVAKDAPLPSGPATHLISDAVARLENAAGAARRFHNQTGAAQEAGQQLEASVAVRLASSNQTTDGPSYGHRPNADVHTTPHHAEQHRHRLSSPWDWHHLLSTTHRGHHGEGAAQAQGVGEGEGEGEEADVDHYEDMLIDEAAEVDGTEEGEAGPEAPGGSTADAVQGSLQGATEKSSREKGTPKRPGRVILVGNGKSLLKKKLGKVIDGYDVVGRYNYFRIKGHESQVGEKTHLWFLGELKSPKAPQFDRSIRPDRYIVPISWPASKGCKKCFPKSGTIKQVKKTGAKVMAKWKSAGLGSKVEIMDDTVLRELRSKYQFRQQWPSTGITSIIYCLKYYNPPITVTGFDFGSASKKDCRWNGCVSKVLGHWFQKNYKTQTVHNMYAEGMFLKGLAKRKLVKII